jgi:DNA repair exonuclease SbcCD ATPase subunit
MTFRGILIRVSPPLALSLFIGAGCDARADEPASAADQVRSILEIAWKPSPESYETAKQRYEEAKAAVPGDVRIPYALALVAMRNYQSKEAGKYLAEALSGGKPLLPIRRVQIYLEVLEKNKDAAVADLKQLVQVLAAADPNRADAQETSRGLGQVIGYLKGPGSGQLSPDQVAALGTEISGKLNGVLGDTYASGASQAANQYAQFQKQLSQAHQDAKTRNETKLAESRKHNDIALTNATQSRSSVEEAYNKLKESYQQEAANKSSQLDQLARNFKDLNVSITQMQNLLSGEQQKRTDQQNNAYITQLQDSIKIANENQKKLDQQARDIRAWFKERDREDRSMSQELSKLQTLEDGLTRRSKDLEKTNVNDNDSGTAALESKVASFKTYADIDLEQEKNRILKTFEPKAVAVQQPK